MQKQVPRGFTPRVRGYASSDTEWCVEDKSWYIHEDGTARGSSDTHCSPYVFNSEDEAQDALNLYNRRSGNMSKFTKDMLKTGMVVTIEDELGDISSYVVMKGTKDGDLFIAPDSYLRFDYVTDTLEDTGNNFGEYTVLTVSVPTRTSDLIHAFEAPCDVRWTRHAKIKEMTLADVCSELGYDVKIVK